ncbi:MAG TPA: TerB family tellurite resistance protein [Burkholderiales bacterium]|nr:TerB family tellurite resistance protein [Burkholderiales bacterium]
MIKALKRLVGGEPSEGHAIPGHERHHLMVSVAVLLHEARRADYAEGKDESDVAVQALIELFGVDAKNAVSILEEGRARAQQLTSFYAPIATIKRDFSLEQRIDLIEQLWRISFADGQLNLYEDHYVRKIAHLLYVPNTQSMLARNRAKEK